MQILLTILIENWEKIIAGIGVAFGGLAILSRNKAKSKAESDVAKAKVETQHANARAENLKAHNNHLKSALNENDKVGSMSDSDVDKQLRDEWTRP